jgi:hypothetical protein
MSQQWTDEDVKRTFCWLFEWTFCRELSPAQRSEIIEELSHGVAAHDPSVRELVSYVITTARTVLGTAQRHWGQYMVQSRAIWENQFRLHEDNGRGRLMALLARIFVPGLAPTPNPAPAPLSQPNWPAPAANYAAPVGGYAGAPAHQPPMQPMSPQFAQPYPMSMMQNNMQSMLEQLTRERLTSELQHKIKMADLQGAQKVVDNWR